MTFGLLKSRILAHSYLANLEESDQYSPLGDFYEDLDNSQGGADFLASELEYFLEKNSVGKEYGRLKDYSAELQRMQCVSITLPHSSRNSYICNNYKKYKVFVCK